MLGKGDSSRSKASQPLFVATGMKHVRFDDGIWSDGRWCKMELSSVWCQWQQAKSDGQAQRTGDGDLTELYDDGGV